MIALFANAQVLQYLSVWFSLLAYCMAYHAYLQMKKTKCFISYKDAFLAKWHARQYHIIPAEEENKPSAIPPANPVPNLPTTTTVGFYEELLGTARDIGL